MKYLILFYKITISYFFMLDKENDYAEVLQKEIDWLKLSMDTDKHDHSNLIITRLQVITIFIAGYGIIATVLISKDFGQYVLGLFGILLSFCFLYCLYEIYKPNGLKNMQFEFRIKKHLIRKRYEKMGIDIEGIQKEFKKLKDIY